MNTDNNTDKREIQGDVSGNGSIDAQPLQEATRHDLIAALNQNWQREIEGMHTYRDLAASEKDREIGRASCRERV